MSEEKKEKRLHQHLAEVMAKVGYVQKEGKNDFHKYKYARAEDVFRKVNTELAARGICISSNVHLERYEENHAVVKLTLAFHLADEHIVVQGLGEGSDKGDKAVMKASTAALKYALASAFIISWGDDPEEDASTDRAANIVDVWLPKIKETRSIDALEALVPELEALTSKKQITAGQATKLRKAFVAQKETLK